jgi:hypothetical protein
MAIDLATIPPEARARFIKLGRCFSSRRTLKQSRRTLGALGSYGELIAIYGFGAEDTEDMTQCRDLLIEAGVERDATVAQRKTTKKDFLKAMRAGKDARLHGRSVLFTAQRLLSLSIVEGAAAARNGVATALEKTESCGDDSDQLANQLDQLRASLSLPVVAALVAGRGGPQAVAALTTSATALRLLTDNRPVRGGTPEETERLDLIDGIIVTLARSARRAARSATRALGRPALADAFKLSDLYGSSTSAEEPPPAEVTETAPEATEPTGEGAG